MRWDFECNANNKDYVTPAGSRGCASRLSGLGGARDRSRGLHLRRQQPEAVLRRVPATAWRLLRRARRPRPRLLRRRRPLLRSPAVHPGRDRAAAERRTRSLALLLRTGGPARGTGQRLADANCAQWTDALRDPETCGLRGVAFALGGLSGGSVWVLNNKTKMPYSDQFTWASASGLATSRRH